MKAYTYIIFTTALLSGSTFAQTAQSSADQIINAASFGAENAAAEESCEVPQGVQTPTSFAAFAEKLQTSPVPSVVIFAISNCAPCAALEGRMTAIQSALEDEFQLIKVDMAAVSETENGAEDVKKFMEFISARGGPNHINNMSFPMSITVSNEGQARSGFETGLGSSTPGMLALSAMTNVSATTLDGDTENPEVPEARDGANSTIRFFVPHSRSAQTRPLTPLSSTQASINSAFVSSMMLMREMDREDRPDIQWVGFDTRALAGFALNNGIHRRQLSVSLDSTTNPTALADDAAVQNYFLEIANRNNDTE